MKEKKTSRACSVLPYYDYYYKLHAAQKDGLELFSIELDQKFFGKNHHTFRTH